MKALQKSTGSGGAGYTIDNSLIFKGNGNATYLDRTPAGAGNSDVLTLRMMFKFTDIGTRGTLLTAGSGVSYTQIQIRPDAKLAIQNVVSSVTKIDYRSTAVFRDPSGWYDLIIAVDQITGNDMLVWLNGEQITAWDTQVGTGLTDGTDWLLNSTAIHTIGATASAGASEEFGGYLSEIILLDGIAVNNPDDFGEFDANGVWVPVDPSGLTFGTNGFWLDFGTTYADHPMSATASVIHSTAQQKFGTSSIYCASAGDLVTTPHMYDLDLTGGGADKDFTVECWFRTTATAASILGNWSASTGIDVWIINSTSMYFYNGNNSPTGTWAGATITDNTWHHIAWCRQDGVDYYFLDGVPGTKGGTTGNNASATTPFTIGSTTFAGYIDEVRLSGIARWTADFSASLPSSSYTTDDDTILLVQSNTINGSTVFEDISGNVGGLGRDSSGNANHWTPTNIVTTDQSTDTPTNNLPTFNSVAASADQVTLSEGNSHLVSRALHDTIPATIGASSGKWYWEVEVVSQSNFIAIGAGRLNKDGTGLSTKEVGVGWIYAGDVEFENDGGRGGYGPSYTTGDVIGIALDLDNGDSPGQATIWFSKNGSWVDGDGTVGDLLASDIAAYNATAVTASAYSNLPSGETWRPMASGNTTSEIFDLRMKEADWTGTAPDGFSAMVLPNLPAPAITDGSENFATNLALGSAIDASNQFSSGLRWIKNRDSVASHILIDNVRGYGLQINSDSTAVESAYSGSSGTDNFVMWEWLGGGSAVSNIDGTITSSVSANTTAGFSIVSYTGNDTAGATVGHGLDQEAEFVIVKRRSTGGSGQVSAKPAGDYSYLVLDGTNAAVLDSTVFQIHTTTAFKLGASANVNGSIYTYIAYCWHSVPGYSKIGSYVGNGNADGPFVYCGFRPAFLLHKPSDAVNNWYMYDNVRDTYNPVLAYINPNNSGAEASSVNIDFVSNGFKIRSSGAYCNELNKTFIFMAFAEVPMGGAGIAPANAR